MAKPGKKFARPLGASEHVLADGRVTTPGEPVLLDGDAQSDPHNKRLIDEGQLVEVKESPQSSGGEK